MKKIPFYVIDAFTDTPFHGNPAGVFFDDNAVLSAEEMQRMAGEVSLESSFVTPGDGEVAFRLRYFTGAMEIPFCGHDTVATTIALIQAGRIPPIGEVVFGTPVGPLTVGVRIEDNCTYATLHQKAPEFGNPLSPGETAAVADSLGCSTQAILDTGFPARVVSTGTPWLLAPVNSRAAVDAAPGDLTAIAELSRRHGTVGIYVFTVEKQGDKTTLWSRAFCPVAGLNEDPVTGSASGAVGCYLAEHGIIATDTEIEAKQGFAGGRGGTARISVRRETAGSLGASVTGTAVLMAEGTFTLP